MTDILPPPPPPAGHNRDALLLQWDELKKQVAELTKKELELRKEIQTMEFGANAKSGTQRVDLGNGYKLKAVIKYNYSITKNEAVDPADYSHIAPALSKLPWDIANRLVKWKPELSESTYKELTEVEREIANTFIKITQGAGTLEIEAPKVKK